MRSMQPRTRILGIRIEEKTDETTGEKERFFIKPAPAGYALHWKNHAKKLKVQADPTAYTGVMEKMMYRVPVYQGVDNKLLRYLLSAHKYAAKLASADWIAGTYKKPEPEPLPDLTFSGGAWPRTKDLPLSFTDGRF